MVLRYIKMRRLVWGMNMRVIGGGTKGAGTGGVVYASDFPFFPSLLSSLPFH